jgi:nitrous oxide reductase accessory protein NosL
MRRKSYFAFVIVGLLAWIATGCGADAGPPGPRALDPAVDICEYCHMTVDDPGRAAQWVEPGGRRLLFDEPGCLVAWLQGRSEIAGEAFFGDAEETGWVPAGEVVFVRNGPTTGMGFDIVAYRYREQAERIAGEMGGHVMNWSELLREGVPDGHTH